MPLSPTAERMRLHRARRRLGLRCFNVEIRQAEIAELARRGYLSRGSGDDADVVIAALHHFLDDSLGSAERSAKLGAR
jgi:hypothetical protein